jgi:hypothetical protein
VIIISQGNPPPPNYKPERSMQNIWNPGSLFSEVENNNSNSLINVLDIVPPDDYLEKDQNM